jgi:hypothetical protein
MPVNVDFTVVGGKFVVKEGHSTTLDLPRLVEDHNRIASKLIAAG